MIFSDPADTAAQHLRPEITLYTLKLADSKKIK
jgi:hypothetical protein